MATQYLVRRLLLGAACLALFFISACSEMGVNYLPPEGGGGALMQLHFDFVDIGNNEESGEVELEMKAGQLFQAQIDFSGFDDLEGELMHVELVRAATGDIVASYAFTDSEDYMLGPLWVQHDGIYLLRFTEQPANNDNIYVNVFYTTDAYLNPEAFTSPGLNETRDTALPVDPYFRPMPGSARQLNILDMNEYSPDWDYFSLTLKAGEMVVAVLYQFPPVDPMMSGEPPLVYLYDADGNTIGEAVFGIPFHPGATSMMVSMGDIQEDGTYYLAVGNASGISNLAVFVNAMLAPKPGDLPDDFTYAIPGDFPFPLASHVGHGKLIESLDLVGSTAEVYDASNYYDLWIDTTGLLDIHLNIPSDDAFARGEYFVQADGLLYTPVEHECTEPPCFPTVMDIRSLPTFFSVISGGGDEWFSGIHDFQLKTELAPGFTLTRSFYFHNDLPHMRMDVTLQNDTGAALTNVSYLEQFDVTEEGLGSCGLENGYAVTDTSDGHTLILFGGDDQTVISFIDPSTSIPELYAAPFNPSGSCDYHPGAILYAPELEDGGSLTGTYYIAAADNELGGDLIVEGLGRATRYTRTDVYNLSMVAGARSFSVTAPSTGALNLTTGQDSRNLAEPLMRLIYEDGSYSEPATSFFVNFNRPNPPMYLQVYDANDWDFGGGEYIYYSEEAKTLVLPFISR